MSISPLDSSASAGAPLPVPSTQVGKAAPIADPIVSSGAAVPAATANPVSATRAVSHSDVIKAVDALNNSSVFRDTDLSFSTDPESDLTVVKITDSKTDQVIRQIPSKEALALTHSIDATLRGNLIDQKA